MAGFTNGSVEKAIIELDGYAKEQVMQWTNSNVSAFSYHVQAFDFIYIFNVGQRHFNVLES